MAGVSSCELLRNSFSCYQQPKPNAQRDPLADKGQPTKSLLGQTDAHARIPGAEERKSWNG